MSIRNEALCVAIRERLSSDWRIASLAIDVISDEGSVILQGIVDTEEQKSLALSLVAGLIGVRNVTSHIRVRSHGTSTIDMEASL